MKQEMRDAVMAQRGIQQLPAVLRRADDDQILREHVDFEHIQESRRIAFVVRAGNTAANRPAETRSCPSCSGRASGRS